ncbi:MAG: hypothetical protein KC444_08110 [Nitrosopumilus sp.]|nr:hypothetical protein [Nitrosopumilus sp.]
MFECLEPKLVTALFKESITIEVGGNKLLNSVEKIIPPNIIMLIVVPDFRNI